MLDEATSALDSASEAVVQKAIDELTTTRQASTDGDDVGGRGCLFLCLDSRYGGKANNTDHSPSFIDYHQCRSDTGDSRWTAGRTRHPHRAVD